MVRKHSQNALRIIVSNKNPVTNKTSELAALIHRASITERNARASFYGEFTQEDINRWRELP